MSEETLSVTREPIEARLLNAVYLLLGVVFFAVLIWTQLDADGPRDWFERRRELWRERRRYHEAMLQTLDDIDDLPETGDGDEVRGLG